MPKREPKSMLTPEHQAVLDRVVEQSKRWGCFTMGQLMDKLNSQHNEIERLLVALQMISTIYGGPGLSPEEAEVQMRTIAEDAVRASQQSAQEKSS